MIILTEKLRKVNFQMMLTTYIDINNTTKGDININSNKNKIGYKRNHKYD